MRDSSTVVELSAVRYEYPSFVLGPQTWSLGERSRCALVGANGAGKTTLLSLLAGQLPATAGTLRVSGIDAARDPIGIRRRVAFVAERLLCCPWLTVAQHFRLQSQFFDDWDMGVAKDAARALDLDLNAGLSTLSRGNSLKVALCSGFAQRASLLLLDEPTAGLDPVARVEFLRLLTRELATRPGLTVVYATHILEDLDDLSATDLIVLRNGRAEFVPNASAADEGTAAVARRHLLSVTTDRSRATICQVPT